MFYYIIEKGVMKYIYMNLLYYFIVSCVRCMERILWVKSAVKKWCVYLVKDVQMSIMKGEVADRLWWTVIIYVKSIKRLDRIRNSQLQSYPSVPLRFHKPSSTKLWAKTWISQILCSVGANTVRLSHMKRIRSGLMKKTRNTIRR